MFPVCPPLPPSPTPLPPLPPPPVCPPPRHETDLKDNNYWLGLLTHLQSPDVPYKRVECLRDLRTMYESATTDDLYDAYTHFDFSDEGVFTVSVNGREGGPQVCGLWWWWWGVCVCVCAGRQQSWKVVAVADK